MFGIVRTVEFNEELNQSRLHFECIHIEPSMKNQILSYVYNIMPESEKEIYDALKLTDTDESEEHKNEGNSRKDSETTAEKAEELSQKIADTDDVLTNAQNLKNETQEIRTPEEEVIDSDEMDLDGE